MAQKSRDHISEVENSLTTLREQMKKTQDLLSLSPKKETLVGLKAGTKTSGTMVGGHLIKPPTPFKTNS